MSEIAERVLDGTLCKDCRTFLNAIAPGYPCRCDACKRLGKHAKSAQFCAVRKTIRSKQ